CAVEGLDAIFIGRSDLTVSMDYRDRNHPDVMKAVEAVAASGKAAGLAIGTFTAELSEIAHWQQCGISLFLLGSQIGFMVAGGQAFATRFRDAAGG
ncbi:MAG: aldolase/citrate lyase family protein, partial [Pseudomonadota bacterium]